MTKTKQQQKQQKKQNNTDHPIELTFLEHVHEVRKRVFWVILTLVVTSAAGFQIKDQLIAAIMAPLHGEKLIYLTPGGGFSFIFTASLYFGALFTIPVIIYQLYKFLQPLMKRVSRRFIATFLLLSCLLAIVGAAFGYFVTIPAALNFLSTFAGDAVTPSLTAESYLSFIVSYVLGLAVLFQIPLLLFLFDHIRPFPPGSLSSSQRFVIIAATVIAAVITPTPDAFNMAVVAIPIIIIYEVGVVAVFIRHRFGKRMAKTAVVASIPSVTVRQEPLTAHVEDRELVTDLIMEHIAELPAIEQPRTFRTMDGIIVTRKPPSRVEVPTRSAADVRLAAPRMNPSRPIRSIDGFSMG